ncbi:MAG TPA: metallophosphoesterase [Candidatus Acidoferrales bacterium]|jgi:predicted MPP superfamily phosphohydrolase|nr:metallophosphoesterase [Candidatus Acidoferrales bacterium]
MLSFPTVYKSVIAHWRVIFFLLVFAWAAFRVVHPDEEGRFFDLFFIALPVMLIASQLFWIRRILDIGERFIPGKPRRAWLAVITGAVYVFFFAYSFTHLGVIHQATMGHIAGPADSSLRSVLMEGAFTWWLVGSWMGFCLVIVFWTVDRVGRAAAWVYSRARDTAAAHVAASKPPPIAVPSPARRRFLEQTAIVLCATPFVASAYGLLFGRLDVEVTRQRIRMARLPKGFEGFRIAQLSDLHISPFMPADQIRRCVTLTNQLKPDLVAMTGDYLLWDPAAQGEVVQALAGLRAPHGVFGCLGNHEWITETEESITRLFAAQGIRILRQERAPIRLGGDSLNLIGIDDSQPDLKVIARQVMPDTVNILLVHDQAPNGFNQAVELGIDLTLAGHTHGGQLSLDFLRRGLCLARVETPYVSGWYEKDGGQLYVNRGIGTTMFPIRVGARPEITVLELSAT